MSGPFPAVLFACASLTLFAACGGGDTDAAEETPGNSAAEPTPTAPPHDAATAPMLEGPASKYAINQLDLDPGYLTDVSATYELTAGDYSDTALFENRPEGLRLLDDWGYVEGYETGYLAEGGQAAVLQGAFFFWVESHLFEDETGAGKAYEYMVERLDESVSEPITAYPVGNESSAWKTAGEPIGTSSVRSVLHRVVFRRGNLVGVVATYGADPLMTVHKATELSQIADQKALGQRETPIPTPTSNFTPQSSVSTTPTPGR